MRQGGSKTTAMPWRAVGLKDFLKVKRCWKNQWNTGLMATRNPARKAVEGTVVLSHHLHGAIHLRWCRISSINSINESINKYSRNIKIQNQWKIYCLFVLQKKRSPASLKISGWIPAWVFCRVLSHDSEQLQGVKGCYVPSDTLSNKKFDPMHATHQICDNETSVFSWKPRFFFGTCDGT